MCRPLENHLGKHEQNVNIQGELDWCDECGGRVCGLCGGCYDAENCRRPPLVMKVVYVQEFNKDVPYHKHTLEGTKKFPVYAIGYSAPDYIGVSPVSIETCAFQENDDGSYSSLFAHVLKNQKHKKKIYSVFFPPHPEDNVNDVHLLRKCKFIREVEKEKIYADGLGLMGLIPGVPELGSILSKPVRVAFDVYWEVVSEN